MAYRPSKFQSLEAVRGLACCVVVIGHYFSNYGVAIPLWAMDTPFLLLFNGKAAVMLFFVLSGFVLSLRPLRDGGSVMAALKRWPRLAGPVIASSLFYIAGAFWLFPSPALVLGRMQKFLPIILWGTNLADWQWADVLWEAAVRTFWLGTAVHNDVLWSMYWELYGSFLVLALCAAVRYGPFGAMLVGVGVGTMLHSAYFLPFVAGFAGAYLHRPDREMSGRVAIISLGVAVPLLSIPSYDDHSLWLVAAYTVGAALVLSVALYQPTVRRWLSRPSLAFLGRMSFAIYLTHVFVLCSFTAWACVWLNATMPHWWVYIPLFPATCAVVALVAYPVMWVDERWVRLLNRAVVA